jgi:hypothetical protein
MLEAEHDGLHAGAVDEIELREVEPHGAAVFPVLPQPLLDGIGNRDVELSDQGDAQCSVAVDAFLYFKRWPGEWHADDVVSNGRDAGRAILTEARGRNRHRWRLYAHRREAPLVPGIRRRLATAAAGLPGPLREGTYAIGAGSGRT